MNNRNEYPENWDDEIRPAILKRDGYKCTTCGVAHRQRQVLGDDNKWVNILKSERAWYDDRGYTTRVVFLQVCHIDNIKEHCEPSNLITKCPQHHALMDAAWKRVIKMSNYRKKKE